MAVPSYQDFMLPAVRLCDLPDGRVTADTAEAIAKEFKLSDEDRAAMLPGGGQTQLRNRVQWACYYLYRAGLLERPRRGCYRTTARGKELLANPPPKITDQYLRRFPEFESFYLGGDGSKKNPSVDEVTKDTSVEIATPSERLEAAYSDLRNALTADILDKVRKVTPAFFEQLVVDVLVAMGYGGSASDASASVTGKSGDGGIDGLIKEDKLGLDIIYLQAKRWADNVGRPTVQEFAGSLEGERANKGILITTSGFSEEARQYVRKIGKKIILIDGKQLAELMIDHGVGVTTERRYEIRRVDGDYFEE